MKLTLRRVLLLLWPALIAAVVLLSVLPGRAVPNVPFTDSQEHFTAYLSLAFIPAAIFRRARWAAVAVIAMALLGVILEAVQLRVPGRVFEIHDIAANCAGTIAGTVTGMIVRWLCIYKLQKVNNL